MLCLLGQGGFSEIVAFSQALLCWARSGGGREEQKWSLGPFGPGGIIRNGRFFKGFCNAVPFLGQGDVRHGRCFHMFLLCFALWALEGLRIGRFFKGFAYIWPLGQWGGVSETVAFL